MATLTGFKSVGDSVSSSTNGQQNPVFVFDEADSDSKNEEFVDARSSLHKNQNSGKQQSLADAGAVAIEIGHNIDSATNNSKSNRQANEQQATVIQNAKSKQSSPVTGNQIQKGGNHLSSPNGQAEIGTGSVTTSNLSVDSLQPAKSPRQSCRSPLMALFRGKPRESSRRLYTDEDQFEIEWANLSLEVQKKWYQKFSLSSLLNSQRGADNLEEKPQRPKKILNCVDGRIRSGEITAVLGPSGAGKTSLLNGLFGKYRTAVQGSIRVSGAPSKKHLTVCTIPQSDYLIGYLTTEESLWYASRLKNCEDDFNHDKNIERVIELLGLQRCRNTRINKLSGGQYKRVSIAQEMLSSPDILVLDEPTSGLDSLTCYRTVKVLRDLVEASKEHNLVNPMSIILTIHQPHREVLDLFHSVYIMAVGGQTLYQGPPGEMEECIDKYSGTSLPAQGYNPASFMVELASEEYGRKPIDSMVKHQRDRFRSSTKNHYPQTSTDGSVSSKQMVSDESYRNSNKSRNSGKGDSTITLYPLDTRSDRDRYVDVDLGAGRADAGGSSTSSASSGGGYKDIDARIMTPRSGKNSDGVFWRHVSLMSKRCFLSNTRDPLLCTMRIGAHIFIPLVVALIYGPKMGIPNGCPFYKPEIDLLEYASVGVEEIEEKHDDIRIQFQNVGLHFMVYYAFGLCMLAFTAISFPLIMHVLIKEIRNGWYSLATFILGKMFAELPMAIILPPISVGIIYTMTGQPSSYLEWRYIVQSIILILIIMIAEAKGLIFGALCMNSMQTAVFAASVSTVPFILLSGFLIRIREIPYILQQASKFSYFKHAVEALILTRYGFGMCPCDSELIPVGGTPRIIGIPPQIMSLTDYYVNQFVESATGNSTSNDDDDNDGSTTTETNVVGNNRNVSRIIESVITLAPEIGKADETATTWMASVTASTPEATTTTAIPPTTEAIIVTTAPVYPAPPAPTNTTASTMVDNSTRARRAAVLEAKSQPGGESKKEDSKQGVFFDKLATLLTRANAFGYSIQSCDDVAPFTMKDMRLKDSLLPALIGYLFLYIVILKFISYFIVDFCVKLKL